MQNKPRARAPNYTSSESIHLCDIIEKYKHIIENKKKDGITHQEKQKAWRKVTEEYNSTTTSLQRTQESLRLNYKNMKRTKQQLSKSKMKILGSGGEPPDNKEDPLIEKICSLSAPIKSNLSTSNSIETLSDDSQPFTNIRNKLKWKPDPSLISSKKLRKSTEPSVSSKFKSLADAKMELVELQKTLIQRQIVAEDQRILNLKLENDVLQMKLKGEEKKLQ